MGYGWYHVLAVRLLQNVPLVIPLLVSPFLPLGPSVAAVRPHACWQMYRLWTRLFFVTCCSRHSGSLCPPLQFYGIWTLHSRLLWQIPDRLVATLPICLPCASIFCMYGSLSTFSAFLILHLRPGYLHSTFFSPTRHLFPTFHQPRIYLYSTFRKPGIHLFPPSGSLW